MQDSTKNIPTDGLPSVLVAEDDAITRRLLTSFLEKAGHTVLEASNGKEAWESFLQHEPKLVITDWRMPEMSGLELCKKIRSQSEGYTFVIILTSDTDRDAMCEGFASGADDFVTKPFDKAELNWRVNSGVRMIQLHESLEVRIRQLDEARKKLESANSDMRAGLAAAAKSQQSLLPTARPEVKHMACSWFYEPCEDLGGDSLNVFRLADSKLGFYLADVCGHGIPSALLAATIHRVLTPTPGAPSLLTASGDDPLDLFSDPGRVLTEVNRRLPISIDDGEYFTAVYGVIDTSSKEMHYAAAGHPSPVLVHNGKPALLSSDGMPIGFVDSTEYETMTVPFQTGDRLYIYSDGFVEEVNPDGEQYGYERFTKKLARLTESRLEEVVWDLVNELKSWTTTPVQNDDISLLVLEYSEQETPYCPRVLSQASTK